MALRFLNNGYFAGKVGIGVGIPESLLHIKGADPILLIQDDSTGTAQASSTLRLGESGASGVLDIYWDIKQAADDLNTHLEINHSSNGNAFAITDNRNVGIGTLVPRVQTEVQGSAQQAANISDSGNSGGTLQVSDTSNAVNAGGTILFAAKNDNDTYTPQASIKSLLQNGNGQGIGDLAFSTRNATADTTLTERMRITSDGIIKVATRQALKPSIFGYSSSYKTLVIGSTSANYQTEAVTLAFNVDVGANTDGSFTGNGSELLFRNIAKFITPNADNTGYVKPLTLNNGRVGIGTQAPNALLEVDSITYSANNAIANFVNGNNPVRVAYDTVVVSQQDVPCLSIVETIDGSQANEQKLSFSVGDGTAIIRSSATATNGLYINVAGTNTAPGYNTADGLNAIRVLNNGDSIFNYDVGIGTTGPTEKLQVDGNTQLGRNGNNTAGDPQKTIISGQGIEDAGTGNFYGSYGFLELNANNNYTGSARRIAITNGLDANKFAIIRSDTNMGPMQLGVGGAVPTGAVADFVIDTLGNVGIRTTTPQSKLQVDGGIQMANDTDTASATKVGTMRYRTGTEYVEVTGTELVTNGDFATDSGWTKGTGWTISAGTANAATTTSDFTQTVSFTLGQTYRLTYTVSNYSAGTLQTNLGAYTANTPISANGTYTDILTPTNTSSNSLLYFYGPTAFAGSIDNVSLMEVTAEDASYADMCMQTGASTYEWVNIVRNTY